MSPVLDVDRLSTHFLTPAGPLRAVDDVSFSLNKGQILGLVGSPVRASRSLPFRSWA